MVCARSVWLRSPVVCKKSDVQVERVDFGLSLAYALESSFAEAHWADSRGAFRKKKKKGDQSEFSNFSNSREIIRTAQSLLRSAVASVHLVFVQKERNSSQRSYSVNQEETVVLVAELSYSFQVLLCSSARFCVSEIQMSKKKIK